MKVCVVGSGGREHALAHVLARTAEVVVTPGNPGMARAGLAVTDAPPTEVEADLVVIGPGADGARLEGSKAWMKQVLAEAGVPTAAHGSFTDLEPALAFLDELDGLYVVKTDGLAAGKGVLVTESLDEARDGVAAYLSGEAFGDAGRTVVIEEGLTGPELSVLALCDGERAVPLAPAQDFKRVGDGDQGPNTGGMGAYSPVPLATRDVVDLVMDAAVDPTLTALRSRGIDYRGVLYAGLMLTPDGPKVLEFNVRFGDPETQVVVPRLEGDLAQLLHEAAGGALRTEPTFVDDAAVTVVCASEGYPSSPRVGDPIDGIDAATDLGATVFCAGVGVDDRDQLVTAGGRVLAVTGFGPTLADARARAYAGVLAVNFPGMHYRTDIAADAALAEGVHASTDEEGDRP